MTAGLVTGGREKPLIVANVCSGHRWRGSPGVAGGDGAGHCVDTGSGRARIDHPGTEGITPGAATVAAEPD